MISFLKCDDFPEKQYFDASDESTFFLRREECKHYEITMKRQSEDRQFKKFIVTIICKGCKTEDREEFKENKYIFQYKCIKCNYFPMTFGYENILENNKKDMQNKKDNIKEEENNNVINPNIQELMNDKVIGGNEEMHIEDKNPQKKPEDINNKSNDKAEPKRYKTPEDIEINNNDSNIKNFITIPFSYNNRIIKIDLDSLEPIEDQYNIIQEKLNFQEIKPLLFNGIEIDMKKSFVDNNIKGIIEVSDD